MTKGVQYDRKLIELAETLTEGTANNRLSLKDKRQLHKAIADERVTITIEWWTLD